MGLNKVGPKTADLRTAIQKKLAAQGEKQRAQLAAQGGSGPVNQVNNITKKDGDVTHMNKAPIHNNKYGRGRFNYGAMDLYGAYF